MRICPCHALVLGIVMLCLPVMAAADAAQPAASLENLPIRAVSIFKDGHALLLHRGKVRLDDRGEAVIDGVPKPVLGTFWAGAVSPGLHLSRVTASEQRVEKPIPASSIGELLQANVGKKVSLIVDGLGQMEGVVRAVPAPSAEPTIPYHPPASRGLLPVAAHKSGPTLVLLETDEGLQAILLSKIQALTLPQSASMAVPHEQTERRLILSFDPSEDAAGREVEVEVVYVQKGIRWIPNYRVSIDGSDAAVFELQATIVNEMLDLRDAPAFFVVGAPTFLFKDMLDPMALLESPPTLSSYFGVSDPQGVLSNTLMSQMTMSARMPDAAQPEGPVEGGGAVLAEESRGENQFLFSIPSLSLRKGDRATVPLKRFVLPVQTAYSLSIPLVPPPDLIRDTKGDKRLELERILRSPITQQSLRFTNSSDAPITTAPATVFKNGQAVAQGMTRYTAVGAEGEIPLNVAVDMACAAEMEETGRSQNVMRFGGNDFGRVDLRGSMRITNRKSERVRIEVRRDLPGRAEFCSHDGRIVALNSLEEAWLNTPEIHWWRWGAWPWWYGSVNPISRISWTIELAPGESTNLTFAWSYHYLH